MLHISCFSPTDICKRSTQQKLHTSLVRRHSYSTRVLPLPPTKRTSFLVHYICLWILSPGSMNFVYQTIPRGLRRFEGWFRSHASTCNLAKQFGVATATKQPEGNRGLSRKEGKGGVFIIIYGIQKGVCI